MQKNITWIIAGLWAVFYSSAQAQTGLSSDQSHLFSRCIMNGGCWEARQHPNFFEFDRIAPALKKFLTPAEYGALVANRGVSLYNLVDNKGVALEFFTRDDRIDAVAFGFCPPEPCGRTLVVSFSWGSSWEIWDVWDVEKTKFAKKLKSQRAPNYEAISRGILGADGQGGKLQILYLYSPTEATYWQEGMAEKTIIKTDSDLFKGICSKVLVDLKPLLKSPAACMQALEQTFAPNLK